MPWKSRLDELGITPLGGDTFSPLSEADLEMIEERVGQKLPDDFREFLSQFGECDLEEYAVFPTDGGGVAPGTFFGKTILSAIDDFAERLPVSVIPINDDGAGNLICISLQSDSYGKVYFQSHSVAYDQTDDDVDAAKFATLVELSDSFSEFISALSVD